MTDQLDSLLQKVERLQDMVVEHATTAWEDNTAYVGLRRELLADPWLRERMPQFVRDSRSLQQVGELVWDGFNHNDDVRRYVWHMFRPLLEELEWSQDTPADAMVSATLASFDPEHVQRVWQKALDRRATDADGAITAARTLLETVCKHILDEAGAPYGEHDDLPKLYRLTATNLRLAPEQYSKVVFKQILGGCKSVVEGLGALRNRAGDAHGQGKHRRIRPASRHAELAVNLAGSVATFLVSTWLAREAERVNLP